jgi:hypothetical protein
MRLKSACAPHQSSLLALDEQSLYCSLSDSKPHTVCGPLRSFVQSDRRIVGATVGASTSNPPLPSPLYGGR